jgi:hypothetical protein
MKTIDEIKDKFTLICTYENIGDYICGWVDCLK